MIRNQCIVCMPLTTWDNTFTNTIVKMMSLLSKENKILFVDYQYTLKDLVNGIKGKAGIPLKRIFGVEERLRKIKTGIDSDVHVLTCPPVFPINWIKHNDSYDRMLNVNAGIVKTSIHNAIKELKMDNIIVINGYNPFMGGPLAGEFNEVLNIYYCYDEIKGDQWYNFHGPKVEDAYMKKADIVITTSDALYASKCGVNKNCYVVKNGVDFEVFNKSAAYIKNDAEEKIVGYTGSIDERFDIELMSFVIGKFSSVRFDFVGRITNEDARKKLETFPNVRLHGPHKPEVVPEFLKKMDVCIIPYLRNEVTKGVYPLKINEYLAAGKPVVMTDFASLPEFESVVKTASSKEKFLEYLKEVLANDSPDKKQLRIDTARKNSWENRVEELSEVVEKFLEIKLKKSA